MRSSRSYDLNYESQGKQLDLLKNLLVYLWPKEKTSFRFRVVFSILCLISAKVISVSVPLILRQIVDTLGHKSMVYTPVALVFAYGFAKISQSFFGEMRDYVFVKVAQYSKRSIALKTFEHMHKLSLAFHLERQTGGLSRVIERGTRGIQFVLSFMLFNIIPICIELLLITGLISYFLDVRFALIIFCTVFIYIVFTLWLTEWRLKFRRDMNQKDDQANSQAVDSLLNYETVKYFNNEVHEKQRFDSFLAEYELSAIKSQSSLSMLNVGQSAIISTGTIVLLALAVKDVERGIFSIGDFVMLTSYMMQLFMPLNFLGFVYREMKQSLIDMAKMFDLQEIKAEVCDAPNAEVFEVDGAAIHFENVSFYYHKDRPILKNLSFKLASRETLAIVGRSGAGKSTLARLLFRFYDPTQGRITIDGQDLKSITQDSLRKNIAVVPQDTVLFNDSLSYNIHYGSPQKKWEEVIKAAKSAKLTKLVKDLPEGWDTLVGERGLKLSGGEKQRVSIARAILKDPPILVFDEATSALDTQTEQEIQKELDQLSKKKSSLIIAHRLSTVMNADRILVLQEGEIAEEGGHVELLNKGGIYAAMWKEQQKKELNGL